MLRTIRRSEVRQGYIRRLLGASRPHAKLSSIHGVDRPPDSGDSQRGAKTKGASGAGLNDRPLLTEPTALQEHLAHLRNTVDQDPAAAIASAKEAVESPHKIIFGRGGMAGSAILTEYPTTGGPIADDQWGDPNEPRGA